MKISPFILLAAMLSFSTVTFADEDIPTFVEADVDGNKFVDEKEFARAKQAGAEPGFAKIDKNGDGKLSKEEYSVILEEDCD